MQVLLRDAPDNLQKKEKLDMLRKLLSFRAIVAVLFLLTTNLFAQIDTGTIVGQVTDPSGAVVAGAAVVVTNTATGVTYNTQTDNAGQYQVPALHPGTYSVRATAAGFESAFRDGILITVQARPAVDFKLALGQTTQTVEVTGASPVLQTQTADEGGVMQSQTVVDLPLNGRRYSDLALLEAGIQKNQQDNNNAPDRFSANGNVDTQNYFALDGLDNNSGSENFEENSVQVIQPPPDALEEFKVQTRTYSVEFGTSAGAIINATFKSGTNHWHGDVWQFVRNNELDANTYFNNKAGLPVGHYTQNQLGGTIGGPIIKNRTFFFGDAQGFISRQALGEYSDVPTPLMLSGNFTELPFSLSSDPVAGQGGCVTGNIVSSSCFDPVSMKLLSIWPSPNIASALGVQGQPGSWTGLPNYAYAGTAINNTHSWDVRVDHVINDKNRVFARYSSLYTNATGLDGLVAWAPNPLVGDGDYVYLSLIAMHNAVAAWDWTISPTKLNELRVGYSRDNSHNLSPNVTYGQSDAAQFGLKGVPITPATAGLPPIGILGMCFFGPILGMGVSQYHPQFQISGVQELTDNLSWLSGNHALKFGFDYHRPGNTLLDVRAMQGQVLDYGIYVGKGAFGLPDFELGNVDTEYLNTALVAHDYNIGYNFYGQDTYRVNSHLTINYGLRYELWSPVLNHQNQQSNFAFADGGDLISVAPGASGWYARSLIHPDYRNFAPRIGFSYQPFSRVVFRGGYGIFYQHTFRIGSECILALNPPYLSSINLSQTVGSTTPVMFMDKGFPTLPPGNAVPLYSIQFRSQDPNERTAYVEQTSFGPEIEITPNTSLDISYVGNFAYKMNRLRNLNQGIVTGFSGGSPIVNFPWPNLNNGTAHSYLEWASNDGQAAYSGLLVSLTRRPVHGAGFGVNYTWSHDLTNYVDNITNGAEAVPQNAYNDGNVERGDGPWDVRQHLEAYSTYQLPVGKGKAYLNNDGVAAHILGDWQINGIFTDETGFPFDITSVDESGTGIGHNEPRPNCIGNAYAGTNKNPRLGPMLQFDAFSLPSPGTFGDCGPRDWHGPGFLNWDFSVFREIPVHEAMRFEFRLEIFNILNHAQFNNPSSFWAPGQEGSFGYVTSNLSNSNPRELQLAMKFYF
jgi:hypothetical protein